MSKNTAFTRRKSRNTIRKKKLKDKRTTGQETANKRHEESHGPKSKKDKNGGE